MMHRLDSLRERAPERGRAIPVVLHEMVGHALGGLGPNAGQTAQRFRQKIKRRGGFQFKTAA